MAASPAVLAYTITSMANQVAGATARATVPDPIERRYALRLVKQRLHRYIRPHSAISCWPPTTTGARSAT
jgi:hypothetical protein